MKVLYRMDAVAAVRAGLEPEVERLAEIALSSLTPEEREELSRCLACADMADLHAEPAEGLPLGDPTKSDVQNVKRILRARIEARRT